MNELERQIRDLSLRSPSSSMDERVFSLLQRSSENIPQAESQSQHASPCMMESCTTKTSLANGPSQTRRGVFSATFAGLSTALLIGIALGNMMPSLWSDSRNSTADNDSSVSTGNVVVSENQVDPEMRTRDPITSGLPAQVRDALKNPSTIGSQFVESSYQSAVTGAVLWEQQNGEVFSVATHVSDRRFDMCRDCHRVGG
jgi:hypothetical protein